MSNLLSIPDVSGSGSISAPSDGFSGGGGGLSGGGGASVSDDAAAPVVRAVLLQQQAVTPMGLGGTTSSVGGGGKDGGLGAGIYLVYDAPDILSDAAMQMVLATGLWHGSRQLVTGSWMGGVAKKTWIPFLIVLLMAILAGSVAGRLCPQGHKLSEIWAQCVAGRL